jgi:septal ring factor EnvC (AmiA/AmiB activator)
MKFSTLGLKCAALVAGLSLVAVVRLHGQAKGSLSEVDIENSELKVNLEKVLGENKQLRDALAETEKTLADMRKNLAATSGESEVFKRQAMELKLRIEALGLDVSGGNSAKLEQRLLAAVSDLRVMAEEKKKLSEAIVQLTEAVALYAKTAPSTNADVTAALEAAKRNANAALGGSSPNAVEALPVSATISDGMAISVRDDLALVVMNIGSKQGVKIGMPFQVIRGDHIVGSVRVVDVREKIAGAVIQDLTTEKDRIKVGDQLKVEAHR